MPAATKAGTMPPHGGNEPVPAPTGVPFPLNAFVGREQDVTILTDLLQRDDVRLVTLTGPGGVGKTRLAMRVAEILVQQTHTSFCFVPLWTTTDPQLVLPTVARALGLVNTSADDLMAQVGIALGDRDLLLVLDNFEHLLPAAVWIPALLRLGSRLRVIVTSRERLRIGCEREVAVAPLPLPRRAGTDFEALAENPAVRLFVERAREIDPAFSWSGEHAVAVAEVCRRLDGLPLAIELAAARIKVLPPPALLARLETRLPLLVGGQRDAPARQRTLRATIG